MDFLSTKEVAAREGCGLTAAKTWAGANGVQTIGAGRRKTFLWTEADIARFHEREKPGRRWPKKEGEIDFDEGEKPRRGRPKKEGKT